MKIVTAKHLAQQKQETILVAAKWYAAREPEKTDLLGIIALNREFGLKPDSAMAAIKLSRKLRAENVARAKLQAIGMRDID